MFFDLRQERSRLFLWIPVLMGAGVFLYMIYPDIGGISYGVIISLLASFILKPPYKIMSIALVFMGLGYETLSVKTHQLSQTVHQLYEKEKGTFIGTIQSQEFLTEKRRFVVQLADGRRVRLSYVGGQAVNIGDDIRFKTTLLPFSKPILDNGFDYGKAAFYKGLSGTGRMTDMRVLRHQDMTSFEVIRSRITQTLLRILPGESGAIAAALVTGERGKISDVTRQAYADAGIAHVLAISGLHLSMIAGLIFMIFRRGLSLNMRLVERYNLKKIAAVATIPFLIAYLLISGQGVPAIRSFIMVGIILVGVVTDRQAISMRTLAIAAIIILAVQPENLTSASFALSFAAVMALIAAYEGGWSPLSDWANNGGKWRRAVVYGLGIIASTVIATLATLPITLYIFNRISLQAIIGNLVAIPLMGFLIMPLLLLVLLLMPFGEPFFIPSILDKSIQWMTDVAQWTASLPGASIQVAKPPQAFIILMVVGGLWLCLWQTRLRFLGMIPVVLALGFLWVKPKPFYWKAPEGQIYWFDGQRLSTFANSRHNGFTEEILQRQLGLTDIRYEPEDLVMAEFDNQDVALLNQRFSWRQHRHLCDDCDLIVSPYRLPDGVQ